jgi:sterol desaturase/sphingolipid hydroxylase (fatty acid hydroxylase superfamily)
MEFGAFEPRSGGGLFLLFLAGMVFVEASWLIWKRKSSYDWKAATASFGVAIGKRFIDAMTAGIAATILFWLYSYRAFTLELNNPVNWVLLIVIFELAYYWHHRLAHEVRWLWATHSVHHTPEEMNLSVAVRLGWTGLLSGSFFFFAPLVLIGFHPVAVFGMLAASLFYQIWIHTELVQKLPRPVEWLLNTPSHHRVHHASNGNYLDKNYGGVLIIWDRIFGTFASETEKPRYGLTVPVNSYNPIKIALWEWRQMLGDALSAKSFRELRHYLFAPPGWSPDNPRRYSKLILNNPFKVETKKERS